MYPFVLELARFFVVGSSNNWFGLVCPAHCTSSWTLIIAIFLSGFGVGALCVVVWLTYVHPLNSSDPSPRLDRAVVPVDRLAAYLHERRRTSGRGN